MHIVVSQVADHGDSLEVQVGRSPGLRVLLPFPLASPDLAREIEWLMGACNVDGASPARISRANTNFANHGADLFDRVFPDSLLCAVASSSSGTSIASSMTDERRVPDCGDSEHIHILVSGDARLQSLHWEALRDPVRGFLAIDPLRSVSRTVPLSMPDSISSPSSWCPPASLRPSPTLNILFVIARVSDDSRDLPLRAESLALMDAVRRDNLPLRLDVVRPGTLTQIRRRLEEHPPGFYAVLHLDCHGARAGLVFQGENGRPNAHITPADISDLVDRHEIPIVLASACRSAHGSSSTPNFAHRLAEISRAARFVIGYAFDVLNASSSCFASSFYCALLRHRSPRECAAIARRSMAENKAREGCDGRVFDREDWCLPVCYDRAPEDARGATWYESCDGPDSRRRDLEFRRSLLQEGSWHDVDDYFIGRDNDLMRLEARVFQPSCSDNVITIHGILGVGKTAFLDYTSWWWCVNGLVCNKHFFSFADCLLTVDAIVDEIFTNGTITVDSGSEGANDNTRHDMNPTETRREGVVRFLREQRHVIVLDDCDCLTSGLHSENGVKGQDRRDNGSQADRTAVDAAIVVSDLAEFLAQLHGGKSIVLIGSRGREDALVARIEEQGRDGMDFATLHSRTPLQQLQTLGPKSSARVASNMLRRLGKQSYTCDPDFSRLLKSCNGIPKVIECALQTLGEDLQCKSIGSCRCPSVVTPSSIVDNDNVRRHVLSSCVIDVKSMLDAMPCQQLVALLYLFPLNFCVTSRVLSLLLQATQATCSSEIWSMCMRSATRAGLLKPHEKSNAHRIHPALPSMLSGLLLNGEKACALPRLAPQQQSVVNSADVDMLQESMYQVYYQLGVQLVTELSSSVTSRRAAADTIECEHVNFEVHLRYAIVNKRPFLFLLWPLVMWLEERNDGQAREALSQALISCLGDFTWNATDDKTSEFARDVVALYIAHGTALCDLANLGNSSSRRKKLTDADLWLARAEALASSLDLDGHQVVCTHERGRVALVSGDVLTAETLFQVSLCQSSSSPIATAHALSSLGYVMLLRDDIPSSVCRMTDSLAAIPSGNDQLRASTLQQLAEAELQRGERQFAAKMAREAILLHRKRVDPLGEGLALNLLVRCVDEGEREILRQAAARCMRQVDAVSGPRCLASVSPVDANFAALDQAKVKPTARAFLRNTPILL
jgi:CHAT domain